MTDRGRVPFAVVGVFLLVSASVLVATSRTRQPPTTEPAAERAIERAERAVVASLRRAARAAAHDAAARPLTRTANTPAGRAIAAAESDPFRAALELRVALALRERLRHATTQVGGVHVVARSPDRPAGEGAGVRAALERVGTERVGPNASAVRVTASDVTLVATRNGRVLDRVTLSPSVVVGSPVLALHDRVKRFEARLNRGPLEPGFGRRLTARLYAATWARGVAQYGGGPVVNVLGTRHVELLANGALLGTTRAVLGDVDPAAPAALRSATLRVAGRDVASGLREGLKRSNRTGTPALPRSVVTGGPATEQRRVHVGPAADRALVNLTDGGIDQVLQRTYTTTVRGRRTVERRSRSVTGGGRPGPEWFRTDREVTSEWSVAPLDDGVASPEGRAAWHRFTTASRLVVRTRAVVRTWEHDGDARRTRRVERTTYAVGLAIWGRPTHATPAPGRPVRTAFQRRASPMGGPNLADAERDAAERFEGRVDRLAERAVRESVYGNATGPWRERVEGQVPTTLRDSVATDVAALHRRVRNLSVAVDRESFATLSVSPARRLANRIRERRGELVGAPERYDHVAGKASVAARAAYLDRVLAALDAQAERHAAAERELDRTLADAGAGGLGRLRRLVDARHGSVETAPPLTDGRFGPLITTVATDPVYLSTATRADGSAPLATRNVNLAVPFGDAAESAVDALTEAVFGEPTVGLGTAGRMLQSAREAATATGNESLARDTRRLSGAVNRSLGRVRRRLTDTLRGRGVGSETRRAAVRTTLAEWDSPAARALALSNGSVTPRVVAAVAAHEPRFREPARRVALRAAVNGTVRRALRSPEVRVAERPTDGVGRRLRWLARTAGRETAGKALEAGANRLRERLRGPLSAVPTGVPVTPVPGYWYATTNLWHVTVRGQYDRVVVRARTGCPPTGTLIYVRDGEPVRLDVDGDGVPERLGRSEHVSFDVSTTVVVAVPPGPRGVGDKDGNADERSDGWSGFDTPSGRSANETT